MQTDEFEKGHELISELTGIKFSKAPKPTPKPTPEPTPEPETQPQGEKKSEVKTDGNKNKTS